jgi:hypothetical protein
MSEKVDSTQDVSNYASWSVDELLSPKNFDLRNKDAISSKWHGNDNNLQIKRMDSQSLGI